jgi:hypothetical protein
MAWTGSVHDPQSIEAELEAAKALFLFCPIRLFAHQKSGWVWGRPGRGWLWGWARTV